MASKQKNDGNEGTTTKSQRKSFLLVPRIKGAASQKAAPGVSQQKRQHCSEITEAANDASFAELLLGDIVSISGVKSGILRYFGPTKFAAGVWCGIELSCQDGKHDGTVKGVRYFACPPNRGIFAPNHKVALVSRTNSTETQKSKDAFPLTNSNLSHLTKSRKSTSNVTQCVSQAKAHKSPVGGGIEGRQTWGRGLEKRSRKAVKQTSSSTKSTFAVGSGSGACIRDEPPIDPHKALTFAYDIEPNSPDSDLTVQQLNDTFNVTANVTVNVTANVTARRLPRSHSAVTDLFSPVFPRGGKLPRSLSQFAVVRASWRDEYDDPLTPSQVSNASSLGLLTDTQLNSVNFSLDLPRDDQQLSATQLNYELDWDMSDISSPQQSDGDKDIRSPCPVGREAVNPVVPLRLEASGGHTSTPVSPAQTTRQVVSSGLYDLVTADGISDDIGHNVINVDKVSEDMVMTDGVGHDWVTAGDIGHDVVTAAGVHHDIVTADDGDHDLVTVGDVGHDVVTAAGVHHGIVTADDGDHDLVTVGDIGHGVVTAAGVDLDLVTMGDIDRDFVTTDTSGTYSDGHDVVMTVYDIHDIVTTTASGHDMDEGGCDLVTTGYPEVITVGQATELTCEVGQEYSTTCIQEPSSKVVSQPTALVSETPHAITTATGHVLVKDPEYTSFTSDLSTDHSNMKSSQICDGDHSIQSNVTKLSRDPRTDDQLLADLSEGHHKRERPVSVLSTCSADTGVELDTVSDRQRPVSIISVSSIDTGYQVETDCDTVTSSWSCDEAPSFMTHSPGCAIVHQIPILNVTYTEQKCLLNTGDDEMRHLEDDSSEASSASISSGGVIKSTTDATVTNLITESKDNIETGQSTEGDIHSGGDIEGDTHCEGDPESAMDRLDIVVSEHQRPNDESNESHLSARSTELHSVCQMTSTSGDTKLDNDNTVNVVADESSYGEFVPTEMTVVPPSDTQKEPDRRQAGRSRLKLLTAPQQKTMPEKTSRKYAGSQIAVSSGKVSPWVRPPSLLLQRETAALKKTTVTPTVTEVKNSKNKMNEKKATVTAGKVLATKLQKPPEAHKRRSNIARKLDLSARKCAPKIQVNVDNSSPSHKRSIPKSKWGNVVSQVDSRKDQHKLKPKEEMKRTACPVKSDTSASHTRHLFPPASKRLGGDNVKRKLTLTGHIATLSSQKSSSPEPSSRSSRSSIDSDRMTSGSSNVRITRPNVKVCPPLMAGKKMRDVSRGLRKNVSSCKYNVHTQLKTPVHQKRSSSSVTKASVIAPMKRAHQPDLVTDSLSNSYTPPEVRHLEALCEARTKQLSHAHIELQQSAVAVEALSVLVNYLCDNLDAFSCPHVTARLGRSEVKLVQVRQHTEQLIIQRDALINEIQCIKQQYADTEKQLQATHQEALKALDEQLRSAHQAKLERVEEHHRVAEMTMKDVSEQRLKEEQRRFQEHLTSSEQEHRQHVQHLNQEHAQTLTDLRNEHTVKLEEITARFQDIKCSLSEKVEHLKNECDGLRHSQQVNMEQFEKQSDLKARHALERCKYMRDEIDSLKCVLELRNQEVQGLRLQKGELQKQLEELPVAQEKILSLEQKVENLEAIINIRDSNEKQLAERHQMLLRRYDRESKANKRLSMNNEELTWRLSQTDILSPGNLTRSFSCSESSRDALTASAKRHSSPPQGAAQSPPSSASGVVRRKKRSTDGAVTSLRRSGTYELLDQQLDVSLRMDAAGGGDHAPQTDPDKRGVMRQTNV